MNCGASSTVERPSDQMEDEGSTPISPLHFDSAWRKTCRVEPVQREDIDSFIKTHYIGRWPGVCVLVLGLKHLTVVGTNVRRQADGSFARLCGGIVFALPPRETAKRYGGVTWELARLWI